MVEVGECVGDVVKQGSKMNEDQVISALVEQVEWYRRLAKLAELQHVYVQSAQTEELLGVLDQRQEVLNAVARLEEVIGPARKHWEEYVGELTVEKRKIAEKMMAEARRLLEAITTADRNDALVLQQRKLNLGKQISQARVARKVNRNYAVAAYGTAKSRVDYSS
jgi:hypothetical protein